MSLVSTIRVEPWDVPMRSPYRSAQRLTTVARNILVRVTLSEGTVGLGESAPATYVTGETQESIVACCRAAALPLLGLPLSEAKERVFADTTLTPGARCAIEMALWDAETRLHGVAAFHAMVASPHALPQLSHVTDISLPLLSPEDAGDRARSFAEQGFHAFKIKVGGPDAAEDEARVRAVAAATDNGTLRIDGNQGFSVEAAVAFVERLSDLVPRLELFEQPTKAGDDAAMAWVQKHIPLPVFADESIHGAEDARRLLGDGTCQGVVLKIAKSAIWETYEIGRAVRASGGRCLFGCMMETRLGITAALHIGTALGPQVVPMLDLDGHLLVNDEGLVHGGLNQNGDILTIDAEQPGLGVDLLI